MDEETAAQETAGFGIKNLAGNQTPPDQTQLPKTSTFNYQRKRQAHSPAEEFRQQQFDINSRINDLDQTMNNLISTVHGALDQSTTEEHIYISPDQ